MFALVQDSEGNCQLTLFPTEALPNPAGFRSVYYTEPGPGTADGYFIFITGPVGPTSPNLITNELYCQADENLNLTCELSAGAAPNLLVNDGGEFEISAAAPQNGLSDFYLVPAL